MEERSVLGIMSPPQLLVPSLPVIQIKPCCELRYELDLMGYSIVSYCYQHIIEFVGNPLARGVQFFAGPTADYVGNAVGYKFRIAVDMA